MKLTAQNTPSTKGAKTIFDTLNDPNSRRLHAGALLIFDELFNYPEYRQHELKALWESLKGGLPLGEFGGKRCLAIKVALRLTHAIYIGLRRGRHLLPRCTLRLFVVRPCRLRPTTPSRGPPFHPTTTNRPCRGAGAGTRGIGATRGRGRLPGHGRRS